MLIDSKISKKNKIKIADLQAQSTSFELVDLLFLDISDSISIVAPWSEC